MRCDLARDVGNHERIMVAGRHEFDAAVGEVHGVALLVEHVEQILLDVADTTCLAAGSLRSAMWSSSIFCTSCLSPCSCSTFMSRLFFGRRAAPCTARSAAAWSSPSASRASRLARRASFTSSVCRRTSRATLALMLEVLAVALVADGPGDDQRRPRLVDEHRVHFVDDRVVVAAAARAGRATPPCCRGGSRSRTRCSSRR